MAIYNENIVDIELNSGSIFRSFLSHSIGSGDELANRFGVRVFRNGEPENIGGTCFGLFVRADGTTVAISSGTVSGNVAYVTLPEACYAVEGQFALAIKCQGSGVTGTMRIVDGVVSRTSTSAAVDPGTIIPSVEDLIEAIEDAVESIPSDYSGMWTTFAPAFSTETAYKAGQYVTYDGKMYKFTTDHTAGTWNSAHATQVNVGGETADLKSALTEQEFLLTVQNSKGSVPSERIIQGSYNRYGEVVVLDNRIRTNGFLDVYEGQSIEFNAGSYANQMLIGYFTTAGVFIEDGTWLSDGAVVGIENDGKIIIVYRDSNGSDISPSQYDATTKIISTWKNAAESRYEVDKVAYILSSAVIDLDTLTWVLKFPTDNYCRVITSYGENISLNSIGNVQLSQSCVIYFKKDTNQIVTKDYFSKITDPNLFLIGVINGKDIININILSQFRINGVITTMTDPEYRFFSGYRYTPSYVAFMGDSITTYTGYSEDTYPAFYPSGDVDEIGKTWWGIVAEGLRIPIEDVTISAISRTSFIPNDTGRPTSYDDDRIYRIGATHYPSYIFVNMGTNDPYSNNLGDMTYESDITALNALADSTTKGIALTIRKLQSHFTNSRIVLIIPKPVNISAVHQSASQYTSELVDKIAERIKKMGELYGVYKVIDLRKCDMNQSNIGTYTTDGIHPNASGMTRMGMYILHELLR